MGKIVHSSITKEISLGKYKVIGLSAKDAEIFACRPCGQDGCEGSKISQCLVQLDPKMVVNQALLMLKPS